MANFPCLCEKIHPLQKRHAHRDPLAPRIRIVRNDVLILFDKNCLIIIANMRALLSHFCRAGRKYKGDEHIDSQELYLPLTRILRGFHI